LLGEEDTKEQASWAGADDNDLTLISEIQANLSSGDKHSLSFFSRAILKPSFAIDQLVDKERPRYE
jgi:hypothetical protein